MYWTRDESKKVGVPAIQAMQANLCLVVVLYGWLQSEDKRAIFSRRQRNSQPVCEVWTGPPPSPPDLKGLLQASRGPFFIATLPLCLIGDFVLRGSPWLDL